VATDSDDRDGAVAAESAARPDHASIILALPAFTGTLSQRPPAYSAIKVAGRRAYALARAGRSPELPARLVEIHELHLLSVPDPDHADFAATVGAGTYIRSLARDLAVHLGTLGHIVELRRESVGRFDETRAISLETAAALGHSLAASEHLLPIETALDDIPALAVTAAEAARLRHGQSILPDDACERRCLAEIGEGAIVGARFDGFVVALARVEAGGIRPVRIINR
jgi:tRNA pseudouridine55 synthase